MALGVSIARRWLASTGAAYRSTGMLHEKMRGDVVGVPGGGGEYLPLDGPFGWSNGVVLKLALLLDFEEDV